MMSGKKRKIMARESVKILQGKLDVESLIAQLNAALAEECVVHAGWLYLSCKAGRKDHARMVRHGK